MISSTPALRGPAPATVRSPWAAARASSSQAGSSSAVQEFGPLPQDSVAPQAVPPQGRPPQALPPGVVPPQASAADEAPPARGLRRRVLPAALAGLALAGAVGGAVHVVDQAPVCPQPASSSISFTDGHVCVSPEFGAQSQAALRTLRGMAHLDDLADDLASGRSHVLPAAAEHAPPRPLMEDGQLRVVTWNIHKAESPDREGARHQDREVVQALKDAHADVYLLQEVAPWQASDIAHETGMVGYFTQTSLSQGNMVLVHPDLAVERNLKENIHRDMPPGDPAVAREAVKDLIEREGVEPRVIQVVEVTLPSGQQMLLWNTHLTNNDQKGQPGFEEQRSQEVGRLLDFATGNARPGEIVVGGGDFNARDGSFVTDELAERGIQVAGHGIDWLTSTGKPVQAQSLTLRDGNGAQLSDHPMIIGSYPASSPAK